MSTNKLLEKTYLNEKEVAAVTGRAVQTIRNDRFNRSGIPYYKISKRSVRYKAEDVIAYMEKRRISFDEVEK